MRYCVRVSSFPANVVVMDLIGQVLLGGTQGHAIVARAVLDVLKGSDAIGSLKKSVMGPTGNPLEGTSELAAAYSNIWPLKTPGEDGADIFPGRRHKLPVGTFEWASRLAIPAPVRRGCGGAGTRPRDLVWVLHFAVACPTHGQRKRPLTDCLPPSLPPSPPAHQKSPADNQAMFDLGRAEALSWAQEAGFPAALARGGHHG